MKNTRKSAISRIIIVGCIMLTVMSANTGNAQGNMLNPVEIMSSLVFSVQRLANGNSMFTVCYSLSDVEIVEVDKFGRKVWSYENELSWTHSANWCEKTKTVLIADTNNNRVIEVNRNKKIVWSYDIDIKYPNDADRLENGNTLITVRDSDKIIEVTPAKRVVWEFDGVKGPHNADRLANGNTIIANSMDNRIVEVDKDGNEVWSYEGKLFWPRDADRLANGNTLIVDSRHKRVIEVDKQGKIVWEFENVPSVYDADRLANGNTLLSADLKPGQVIEVDPKGRIVWRWVSSDLGKQRGFQYCPSERTSYLRVRIRELLKEAENLRIPKLEYNKIRQLLNLARKALFDRQYELNKKLVFDCVLQLEEMIMKHHNCEKGTVKGLVLDEKTLKPVKNAKVFLFGTIYVTETDVNGNFHLPFIPVLNSSYTLIISKSGYFEKQVGGVFPELPYIKNNVKTYKLDKSLKNAAFRNEVLTLNVAFLRKHLMKDKFSVGAKKLVIPDEYPAKIKPYLKLSDVSKHESEMLNNLASEIKGMYENVEDKQAELIVLSALKLLHETSFVNASELRLIDDVISTDWQRFNGRFGTCYNSAIKRDAKKMSLVLLDSHLLVQRCIDLLRILNIPARLAWVKSHPVVTWWAKPADSKGRWLNTEIIWLFNDGNPESWRSSKLHNVDSEDITLVCSHPDYQTYLDWSFKPGGLWVQNHEIEAFFMSNKEGLRDAKFGINNFEKRGFIAGEFDNITTLDAPSVFSFAKHIYEVYDLGVNISLANLRDKTPLKFYVQVPADNDFTTILDVKFFCNRKSWIKSVETLTKTNPDTDEKITIKCLTILPE